MKFFFDNNLPPCLAHGVRELSKFEVDVDAVIHRRDEFAGNARDIEWLTRLGHDRSP